MTERRKINFPEAKSTQQVYDGLMTQKAKFEKDLVREQRKTKEKKKAKRREVNWHIMAAKKQGRPPLYEPFAEEFNRLIYDYRMLGLTAPQVCELLGVSDALLYDWCHRYPLFLEAWNRGGEGADAEISRAMFSRARGFTKITERDTVTKDGDIVTAQVEQYFPPDTAAGKFWLTNRQPRIWKERNSTELTGADGNQLIPPSITINGVVAGLTTIDGDGETT